MTLPILVAYSAPLQAQNVDDMASYMGYRGYTVHRQQDERDPTQLYKSVDYQSSAYSKSSPFLENEDSEVVRLDITRPSYKKDDDTSPSAIENFYRDRTDETGLTQFGYDLFYTTNDSSDDNDTNTSPAGAVQDNYMVQSGDELAILFSGERNDRGVYTVGSDGRLMIEGMPPLTVMGLQLSEVKKNVRTLLNQNNYYGDVEVTVSAIRQIGVLVAGHVNKPGRRNLNAYHSVLDALNMSGGVRKSGSLRNIKIIRNGSSQYVDLYNYITFGGFPQDTVLRDGDRIIVPPLGATVAVTGDVKQPGIFELQAGQGHFQPVGLNQALAMAGGPLGAGDHRFTMIQGDGDIINLAQNATMPINDGAIIKVVRSSDRLTNGIELKGYSRGNGLYDLANTGSLQTLIGDGLIFGDNTYPLIGVISRVSRDALTRNLMVFSPQSIIRDGDDRQLEPGDTVYLFSNKNIRNIIENKEEDEFPKSVSQFVLDHAVHVSGAVYEAGLWPVGITTDLQTLIAVAGGLTSKASPDNIEITSRYNDTERGHQRRKIDAQDMQFSDVMLEPGDQVRINERYDQAVEKSVRITGEVRHPGSYDLMRGDTLLSLIDRAGGMTPDAYPPAAVFSRKAERKREEQKFRSAAQELERTVSVNLNAQDKGATLTPAQISMARQLADDLRSVQAIGRVTVEADPAVLSVRPKVNMLLEDGDHLHIPKRSLNVRVSGEVMNPASLLFDQAKKPHDYIRQAGGTTYYADKGRAFIVYPDGSAQPLDTSMWDGNRMAMIIPGSTIVIPRDPKPFNFMDSFKDITQILSNMAITGVFIDDIVHD